MTRRLALALLLVVAFPQRISTPLPHSFMRSGLPLSVDPYSCWFCGVVETKATEDRPCPRSFKECPLCGQKIP